MSNLTPQKPKFSVAITTKGYQTLINNTIGDPQRATVSGSKKRLEARYFCGC